jgi:LysR family nitrogen assimilation transcriptional regulator
MGVMDIRQLRYFVQIVECGSVSKAAEKLLIAQPSLSQHVLNLEGELDVQLLHRSSRGITATPAGERLLERARNIIADLESIKQDVKETSKGLTGTVVLGMPEKYTTVLTVPIVERIEREFPKIKLRIIENMSGNLLDWVVSGKVDIAILIQVQKNPELTIKPFVSENLYLVGPPSSPYSHLKEIPFRHLADVALTLPSKEHGLRILAEEIATSENITLNVKSEIDSIPAIKSILRLNGGYTLLSDIACKRERSSNYLWAAPIINPEVIQTGVLAYSNQQELPAQISHVRDVILDIKHDLILSGAWPGAVSV